MKNQNLEKYAKVIWASQCQKFPELPRWEKLSSGKKHEFICDLWLIIFLMKRDRLIVESSESNE